MHAGEGEEGGWGSHRFVVLSALQTLRVCIEMRVARIEQRRPR